ncbi:hypothetical protein AG1IA_10273 [Rhizoctonia solani AG-1 IA]|uniref:Uncharacterized protein n=1 Tax=Thanatephorus cucumeris (strain AG1-IA) TaxID=983506 RepID=L8WG54_THACA|nr:hypothetical protein AG1IA_10273 [Rhizoctonia solani AG-1 IA]
MSSSSKRAPIRRGDLVIVEADRGKDLGKVVNDSISLAEVERFMMEGADDGQGGRKEIMPKRIYGRAGPGDTQLLLSKMQDEVKALQSSMPSTNGQSPPPPSLFIRRLTRRV